MNKGLKINRSFHMAKGRRSRNEIREGTAAVVSSGRIPRVARLMALAIRFDKLIRDGVVADQAELARVGHVTRARLTQIMNLLNLSPQIQEEILHSSAIANGRDPLTERSLRAIAAVDDWEKQNRLWKATKGNHRGGN